MRRLLFWVVLVPVAIAIVLFAVANRGLVTVSLDPFSTTAPAYAMTVPLFLVIFAALILGVLVGGFAVSIGKLRWRLAAHRAEREAARLRAESERHGQSEAYREAQTLPVPARRPAGV